MPRMPEKKHRIKSVGKVHGKKKNWLKDQSHTSIYNSRRWRKLSLIYKMNNPVCEVDGCTQPSCITDHIIPISDGGDVWDEDNLQALCKSCNASKTAKQNKKSYNK